MFSSQTKRVQEYNQLLLQGSAENAGFIHSHIQIRNTKNKPCMNVYKASVIPRCRTSKYTVGKCQCSVTAEQLVCPFLLGKTCWRILYQELSASSYCWFGGFLWPSVLCLLVNLNSSFLQSFSRVSLKLFCFQILCQGIPQYLLTNHLISFWGLAPTTSIWCVPPFDVFVLQELA